MKKQLLFVALIAIGGAMSGCKKDKHDHDEIEIHVHSPSKDGAYSSPVPVDIHFDGGEHELHDVEIKIFEKANPSNVVFDYDEHVHSTSLDVEETLSVNVTTSTVFTLEIEAGAGHGSEDATTYSHDFTINP